ncbi:uncharacterized protein LOC116188456 isoform X1 [Punica granatum]|uniref:Uncharacterized protein LOC116188456 isoform X1 n=1 Tax=Punica granatum TaxID=22663 RepID=A0A6P8BTP7_PUNGR|nr:uncharacterized protein LOC116188456 isoform X1 [Punica granatum]
MPQETSPWDRRELKRERSEPVARWRVSPPYRGGSRSFHRAAESRRHTGHGKQGGWHQYPEETGHRYAPYRSFSKTIAVRGDGKYSRGYRDNRGLFDRREYRGEHSWETSRRSFSTMPKPYDDGDIMRDQHSKRSATRLSPSQKIEEKRFVDSTEWKDRRWMNSGRLPSRGSGLGHSSGSKRASRIELVEKNVEYESKSVIPRQSSTEDVADCMYSIGQSEGLTPKKKPRLRWGEGLAKYEKKKVEDPVDTPMDRDIQSNQSTRLDATGRTSGVLGVLESSSPATASSLALISLPDMEDKLIGTMKMGGQVDGVSELPVAMSQSTHQGFSATSDELDISSIASGDPLLVQLLQCNDISLDSNLLSTLVDKLVLMKENVSKVLLTTESQIDSLENELKSIVSEHEDVCASPISSSFAVKDYFRCSLGEDGVASVVSQPDPVQTVTCANSCAEELCYVKGTRSDSHVAATFNTAVQDNHMASQDAAQRTVVEMVKVVSGSESMETSKSLEHVKFLGSAENTLYDLIFSSNKEAANRSSFEVFSDLVLRNHDKLDVAKISCSPDDSRIREKFTQRKRFLTFKERVLALKYKTFHYLWQKDIHALSAMNKLGSQKKLESSSRIRIGGCQKPRSSIHPCVSSSGIMGQLSKKETIHYISKLVRDSCWRIYREALKMPAFDLDERAEIASRFISYNGLVEDPCAVEKERTVINPWTAEERAMFLEKFGKYGKDFRKIATFLKHKTTADCVEFYYRNHKSDLFQGVKKKLGTRARPQLLPANTYLVTPGKLRNREVNAANLLSEASLGASQDQAEAGGGKLDWESCHRRSFLRPCSNSRSSHIDAPDDEREAVAADVLTQIRSSVVHVKNCGEKDLSDWTDVEKSIFMRAVSHYGKDFAMISQYVKTRSKDQCRAFYNKARKCLKLDKMLPGPAGKCLNCDANEGSDGPDGPQVVKIAGAICKNDSVTGKSQDLPVSVKMETADAVDCGLPTDLKETADGSCLMGSRVCEEKCSRVSVKGHDTVPEMKLSKHVSDQSLGASERWLAHLPADSSPCSVFSLGSESKDRSLVETDQVEKPLLAILTDSASFQCVKMKTLNSNNQPENGGQWSHDTKGKVQNLQESENSSHGSDFKLFGRRILTCTPQNYPDLSIHEEDKKRVLKATQSLTGSSNKGRNSSLLKFDPDDHTSLENVSIGSYGYWDGTRIRTVPSLPNSAFLLAKYPAAFSKNPLQELANSSEFNINNCSGPSIIPAWM